jgi:hypothetical protein
MSRRIHRAVFSIVWNVYSRIARRLGQPDPYGPGIAWINTHPRMEKITEWVWKFSPTSNKK